MHVLKILAASTTLALAGNAFAQCSAFANVPPGTNLALGDDTVRAVGLGWNFRFNNVLYNSITVASNGYVWLGSGVGTTVSDLSESTAEMLSQPARLAPCWDDLNPASLSVPVGGGVFYRNDGSSASIVWKGIPRFGSTTIFANMEVIITSDTHATNRNEIYFVYDAAMMVSTSASIMGISRGGAAPVPPITQPPGVTWTAFLPNTAVGSTAYQLFTINTGATPFNLVGQTISFIPTDPNTAIDHACASGAAPGACTPGVYPPLSTQSSVGVGCPVVAQTAIYELFTVNTGLNPFDMANTSIEFVKSGNNYSTIQGPGFDANYSTNGVILAGVGDDTSTTASLGAMTSFQLGTQAAIASVQVDSNGSIFLPTGTSDFSSSASELHTLGARIAGFWVDLVPNTTTVPIYWENTNPAYCQATWQAVPIFTDGGAHTFQITLKSNGNIVVSYQAMTGGVARIPMVGLSGGPGSVNAGTKNLATAGVVNAHSENVTGGAVPMVHTAGLLRIGMPFAMSSTVPPPVSGAGFFILGVSNPAIPLDGIGMPGCTQYASLDNVYFLLFASSPMALSLDVPYDPAFVGVNLFSQAAAFSTLNTFGVIASNGLSHLIGI